MTQTFARTKPSLMEAGLPCAPLSAECQSDNDARQRPPQNRLHIWWARRPPTICRVALVTALTPHDADLRTESTEKVAPPVVAEQLAGLSSSEERHRAYYLQLLEAFLPTPLSNKQQQLLLTLRVLGDPARHYHQSRAARERGMRLPRAFSQYLAREPDKLIPADVISHLRKVWQKYLALPECEAPVILDPMAGGGSIPLNSSPLMS
jgi:adenine-specific DNA methylase